jgi:hypothetical protein
VRRSLFRADDVRPATVRAVRLVRQGRALLSLPGPVRRFYIAALRTAWRTGDQYSLDIVTRPLDLREILAAAGSATRVVETGTATGWTSIALALAHQPRQVTSLDPEVRPERERYLALVSPGVRERIRFVAGPGRSGPQGPEPVEFLFEDGSHECEDTIATVRAWTPALCPGSRIAFHDYGDPAYPGVAQAVTEMGLLGRSVGRLFIWTKPDAAAP